MRFFLLNRIIGWSNFKVISFLLLLVKVVPESKHVTECVNELTGRLLRRMVCFFILKSLLT